MQSLILSGLKHIATFASGVGKKKKLFILIYHRVLDEPDFMRPGEVDKKNFSWQMELLTKYFNVLPLSEALEKMHSNQLPARAVCITFDDGYADNYLNALPIMQKFNLNATFFIANGYLNGGIMWNDKITEAIQLMSSKQLDLNDFKLGVFSINSQDCKSEVAREIINKIKHLAVDERKKIADDIAARVNNIPTDLMMTDEQLIKLHQAGMDIGGHTVTHPIIAGLNQKTLEKELCENKHYLEKLLKSTIKFFAYPNGKPEVDYKIEQIEQIKDQKYQAAMSTQWGVSNKSSDIYQLPRFTPWDKTPVKFMIRMIDMYRKVNVMDI